MLLKVRCAECVDVMMPYIISASMKDNQKFSAIRTGRTLLREAMGKLEVVQG